MKRIWLNADNTPGIVDAAFANQVAVALAEYACDGNRGRVKGDPVFEEITEGRQRCWNSHGKPACYSGCADLAHWVLWNLLGKPTSPSAGLRDRLRAINRQEAFGWKVGANVSLLVRFVSPRAYYVPGDDIGAKPGHIVLIGSQGQEHIAIVHAVESKVLLTYDYGQFFAQFPGAPAQHGGVAVIRAVTRGVDGRPWVWSKTPPGRPLVASIDVGTFIREVHIEYGLEQAYVPDGFGA